MRLKVDSGRFLEGRESVSKVRQGEAVAVQVQWMRRQPNHNHEAAANKVVCKTLGVP